MQSFFATLCMFLSRNVKYLLHFASICDSGMQQNETAHTAHEKGTQNYELKYV